MNTTTWTVDESRGVCEPTRGSLLSIALDLFELSKPRIAVLVLVVVILAGFVARWSQPDPWLLLAAVLGTALVATSASTWNQWMERDTDARMPRTENRPFAASRLGRRDAILFGGGTLIAGILLLWCTVGWLPAAMALITWGLYVLAYTPLKRRSSWNTLVGAVAGAWPVWIGWTAVGGSLTDARGMALFLVVFLWQFPHFMAIAWLYRRQYEQAGIQMITVTDPSGRRAALQAVLGALALVPVSCVPAMISSPSVSPQSLVYLALALGLGLFQLGCALRFASTQNEQTSRCLLKASLVYLPAIFLIMACVPFL